MIRVSLFSALSDLLDCCTFHAKFCVLVVYLVD